MGWERLKLLTMFCGVTFCVNVLESSETIPEAVSDLSGPTQQASLESQPGEISPVELVSLENNSETVNTTKSNISEISGPSSNTENVSHQTSASLQQIQPQPSTPSDTDTKITPKTVFSKKVNRTAASKMNLPRPKSTSKNQTFLKKHTYTAYERSSLFAQEAYTPISKINRDSFKAQTPEEQDRDFYQLYLDALSANEKQREGFSKQDSKADMQAELFCSVFEQILPFATSLGVLEPFLAHFEPREGKHHVLCVQNIFNKYPKLFKTSDINYGDLSEQLYLRVNREEARFKVVTSGAIINTLFDLFAKFVAKNFAKYTKEFPSASRDEIAADLVRMALQQLTPVATRHGRLWAFLAKFRVGNEDSAKALGQAIREQHPGLTEATGTEIGEELKKDMEFYQNYAEGLIRTGRDVLKKYLKLFEKETVFGKIVSPI